MIRVSTNAPRFVVALFVVVCLVVLVVLVSVILAQQPKATIDGSSAWYTTKNATQSAQPEHARVFESNAMEKNACGYHAKNYPHVSDTEWGERCVARMFTPHDAKVLELGGGAGSVSAVIQERLSDKSKHIVVQPQHDKEMFGGLAALVKTKSTLACEFTIVDHELQPGEVNTLTHGTWTPNVLVVDCENCLVSEYNKNPDIFRNLYMIQVERDDFDQAYTPLFEKLDMRKIYTGKGCDGGCATEVWVK